MFARHLILQEYRPDQVTILTTYKGQMFKLRSVSQISIYKVSHEDLLIAISPVIMEVLFYMDEIK